MVVVGGGREVDWVLFVALTTFGEKRRTRIGAKEEVDGRSCVFFRNFIYLRPIMRIEVTLPFYKYNLDISI